MSGKHAVNISALSIATKQSHVASETRDASLREHLYLLHKYVARHNWCAFTMSSRSKVVEIGDLECIESTKVTWKRKARGRPM
jgi:hypothetical protein